MTLLERGPVTRLDNRIREVLRRGEKFLCCIVPLGDPDMQMSRQLVDLFLDSGVDVVELMLPSRDPHFDSPQLHDACSRALMKQPSFQAYLDFLEELRDSFPSEPFEVMTYSDVVQTLGASRFVRGLKAADMDAHLLADSIATDASLLEQLDSLLTTAAICRIRFMPYPFREDLLPDIADHGKGFMILQSISDRSGKRPSVDPQNRVAIERVRASGTEAAIVLAYGIRDSVRAREAVRLDPDGIIVGSTIMERIALKDFEGLARLIRDLKSATKRNA